MSSWGRAVRASLAIAMAGLGAPANVAAAADAATFPDLRATAGQIESPQDWWMFADHPTRLVWWDRTVNVGAAVAPQSLTRLTFSQLIPNGGQGGINWGSGTREVKALKPGEASKATAEATQSLPVKYIGSYYSFVCANRPRRFRESNFSNNCKNLNERFSVTPRWWNGTVDGTGNPYDNVIETWHADVTYSFDREATPRTAQFIYKVYDADIQYSVSGTDADGCTVSGTSPHFVLLNAGESQLQSLRILSSSDNVHPGHYVGYGVLPGTMAYTVSHTCPDPTNDWTEQGPLGPDANWFSTVGTRNLPKVIGFTHLGGGRASPTAPPLSYTWSLDAS